MSQTPSGGPADDAAPADPWLRWGWLLSAIWLVFLAYPVFDLVVTDRPTGVRLLLAVLLVAFVVVYVHGFYVVDRPSGARLPRGWTVVGTLALGAIAVTAIAVQGGSALGMPIYVGAYAVILTPIPVAVATFVLGTGAVAVLGLVEGYVEARFMLPLMVLVLLALAIIRVLEERGREAQLLATERSLVAERERVARDVHDVLGHSLTVITTKAELAERLLGIDTPESRERAAAELGDVQSLGREALTEIRATVSGLRVARLGDELAAACAALDAAGIDAEVPQAPELVDPRRRLVLAWVLREAVTNVVRHSGASRCTVELGAAALRVHDDGVGRRDAPAGNGLRGVAERVRSAGGTLTVVDVPAGGTLLEVSWP